MLEGTRVDGVNGAELMFVMLVVMVLMGVRGASGGLAVTFAKRDRQRFPG